VADGRSPSASNPLFVWRADTDTIERHNGADWQPVAWAGAGSQDVTTLSGFGGSTPTVKWSGNTVELSSRGNITGTFPAGLTELVAPGGVPAGLCPPTN